MLEGERAALGFDTLHIKQIICFINCDQIFFRDVLTFAHDRGLNTSLPHCLSGDTWRLLSVPCYLLLSSAFEASRVCPSVQRRGHQPADEYIHANFVLMSTIFLFTVHCTSLSKRFVVFESQDRLSERS